MHDFRLEDLNVHLKPECEYFTVVAYLCICYEDFN